MCICVIQGTVGYWIQYIRMGLILSIATAKINDHSYYFYEPHTTHLMNDKKIWVFIIKLVIFFFLLNALKGFLVQTHFIAWTFWTL